MPIPNQPPIRINELVRIVIGVPIPVEVRSGVAVSSDRIDG
jgi:hypothetical protein